MFNKKLLVVGLISSALMVGCNKEAEKPDESAMLTTLEQKVNYVVAQNMAQNFKQGGLTIEPDAFALALRDVRDGVESRLTEEEKATVMQTFQEQAMAKREAEQKALSEKNIAEGTAYLEANKAKEGVTVTESGLQYRVITEGTGVVPTATDSVSVHYSGKLLDGTEFDSSIARGEPVTFDVTGVIAGWTEALQLMPKGSKWELVIPSDLAYGPGGNGPIPPNSVLVFEVELLEVNAAK
jgi:FKBP-type peptidyl-prolyl cis-trans isomerase FkpA/FKBP-type peptidyl-prolyl cis-trans isomerase FklB